MIDLDAGAIARITQDFEFVPDELMVDLYTKDGNKLTSFNVGDPWKFLCRKGIGAYPGIQPRQYLYKRDGP